MARVYNFSAGPSMLPESVLLQAQAEMLDWRGSGMSVMEMSHRGKHFGSIAAELEADLRTLLAIPEQYKVLFLQGGATAQFSYIPLNILRDKTTAAYVKTGAWSVKAASDAEKYCQVQIAASAEASQFREIPSIDEWRIDPAAAYLHYTSNETIHGVEFSAVPDITDMPLVCDMSSNILSRPIDVSQFGLIYAGTQKNMGPAGVTIVIVREDLLGAADLSCPEVFNYTEQAKHGSMLNTPATYNWYLVGLVLKWLQAQGGVAAIEQKNIDNAASLYSAIDHSSLYSNTVHVAHRSRMNIPFFLKESRLDEQFLKAANDAGLVALKGHRVLGGMRASLYNAMPKAGVDALIAFMLEFERTH